MYTHTHICIYTYITIRASFWPGIAFNTSVDDSRGCPLHLSCKRQKTRDRARERASETARESKKRAKERERVRENYDI